MSLERNASVEVRRAQLLARSEALRRRLAQEAVALQRPLALADRTRAQVRWLAAHPAWLVAAVALPVVLRPRRTLAWSLKLWGAWRLWRRLRALAQG